jgi:hypothetical protein
MVLLFFVWSSCVFTVVSSVLKLLRHAATGIRGWVPQQSVQAPDELLHETILSTEAAEEEGGDDIREVGSDSAARCPRAASGSVEGAPCVSPSGQGRALSESSVTSIDGGGVADLEAIEALSVDERQRAYLDLLQRHGSSSKMAGSRAPGELASHSVGIYVMILGCVAFFFVAA